MSTTPDFLKKAVGLAQVSGWHHPIESNRRGELLAWLTALGAAAGSGIWAWRLGQMPTLGLTTTVLFGAVALLISFGNWVERNTRLQLTQRGVKFQSPLRQVQLGWSEVDSIKLLAANQGWRVYVEGGGQTFRFQSAGRLRFGDIQEMGIGIPAGEEIAAYIRQQSGLDEIQPGDGGWVCQRQNRA
jgi:hypothetical protein